MVEVVQAISDAKLDDLERHARRDDWHDLLVPSDIRQLIGDLRRARAHLTPNTDLSDERADAVLEEIIGDYLRCDREDAIRAMHQYAAGLQGALAEIRDMTNKRQLPLTTQINDIARTALGDTQ